MDTTPPRFSVVIVSYNVAELLISAVASVCADVKNAGIIGEVIVVDNASHDGSAAQLRLQFPDVNLIANSTNKGFGNAANQGMAAARGEVIVILNPDAGVRPGFFTAVQDFLDREPRVGLLGPHVAAPGAPGSETWHTQSTCRRAYTLATAFCESTPLQWWLGDFPALQRFYCRDLDEATPARVDWVVGACLVVRRAVLQGVGGFDPRFFMYFEETDWCRRIKAAGWEIAYVPQARVLHHRSRSAAQDLIARALNFHHSRHKFLAKEYGRLVALLLRSVIGLLFAVYVGEQAVRSLLRSEDAELRQKVNVFAHVAVWYLTGFPGRGRRLV